MQIRTNPLCPAHGELERTSYHLLQKCYAHTVDRHGGVWLRAEDRSPHRPFISALPIIIALPNCYEMNTVSKSTSLKLCSRNVDILWTYSTGRQLRERFHLLTNDVNSSLVRRVQLKDTFFGHIADVQITM